MRRISAALLGKAYGSSQIISPVLEATDANIKAIGGALSDAAGVWAQMRMEAADGRIAPSMDMTAGLVEAVQLVDRARREGRPITDFLNQTDMFSGEAISPEAGAFLQLFYRDADTGAYRRPTGREKLADSLLFYANEALKTSPEPDMFGVTANPLAILKGAKERINGQSTEQTGLFDRPGTSGQNDAPTGSDGAQRPPEGGADAGSGPSGGVDQEQSAGLGPDGEADRLNAAQDASAEAAQKWLRVSLSGRFALPLPFSGQFSFRPLFPLTLPQTLPGVRGRKAPGFPKAPPWMRRQEL